MRLWASLSLADMVLVMWTLRVERSLSVPGTLQMELVFQSRLFSPFILRKFLSR